MTFQYLGGKLRTVTDRFNRTLTFHYLGEALQSVTDSSGRSVSYLVDANGELTRYTDPEGKVWTYGYEEPAAGEARSHWLTTLTDPLGTTTAINTYDPFGRVIIQEVPRLDNATGAILYEAYNFYFSGFRNLEEDPFGNCTLYYFDEKGRTVGFENALGHRSYNEYDGRHHLLRTTDFRGNSTEYVYDGHHNLELATDAFGKTTRYAYELAQPYRLDYLEDTLLHRVDVAFTATHHLESIEDAVGNIFRRDYCLDGLADCPAGLPRISTDGRSVQTKTKYDPYGHPDEVWTQGPTTTYPAIDYAYDAIGRMTELVDQEGGRTSFDYDDRGLLLSKTDPLGIMATYTYDNAGRLRTRTDRNGDTTTFYYTPSGKRKRIDYPHDPDVTFEYNAHDQLATMIDGLGETSYEYDAIGRLTRIIYPFTDAQGQRVFAVEYRYFDAVDLGGQIGSQIEIVYPGGGDRTVIYTYDALGRLRLVENWLGESVTNQKAIYEYDAAGRLASFTNFNGIVTTYAYDDANRLLDLASPVADYHFRNADGTSSLDGNGNPTNVIQNEPLRPQIAPFQAGYTYNPEKNRLLQAGANGFGYDDDDEGQLLAGYGKGYAFDDANRLVSVSGKAEYIYDGAGSRLQVIEYYDDPAGAITRSIYDAAGNLLAEADETNTITRHYIHGLGLMAMVVPGGLGDEAYCYHFNPTGSTVAMTDRSQAVVNKYAYQPFGKIGVAKEEALPQPFTFVGKYGVMLERNGFYYMRARYYDPLVGRFISEDPIGFAGGDVNLYGYVGNNPFMLMDPSGLCAERGWTPDVKIGIDSPAGGVETTLPFGSGGEPSTAQTTPSFNYPLAPGVNAKVNLSADQQENTISGNVSVTTPISGINASIDTNGETGLNLSGPQMNFPLGYGVNAYIGVEW